MSGGSHNYLCFRDNTDLFNTGTLNDIENMASRLIELGFDDAAKETLHLKYVIKQALVRCETMKYRLDDIWKAVEWLDSNDYDIKEVNEAIEKYRGEKGILNKK